MYYIRQKLGNRYMYYTGSGWNANPNAAFPFSNKQEVERIANNVGGEVVERS